VRGSHSGWLVREYPDGPGPDPQPELLSCYRHQPGLYWRADGAHYDDAEHQRRWQQHKASLDGRAMALPKLSPRSDPTQLSLLE